MARMMKVIEGGHLRELRTASEPTVMTACELATMLRVNRKTIYEAAQRGEIPGALRVGRSLRFSRAAVLKWLGQDRLAPTTTQGADDECPKAKVA